MSQRNHVNANSGKRTSMSPDSASSPCINGSLCEETTPAFLTWPEQVSEKLHFRRPIFLCVLLPIALFTVQYFLVRIHHSEAHGLTVFAVYLGLIGYIVYLIPFNAKLLVRLFSSMSSLVDLDQASFQTWRQSQLKKLFSLKRDFNYFLFLGPLASFTLIYATDFFKKNEPWFGNTASDFFAFGAFLLLCFVGSQFFRFTLEFVKVVEDITKLQLVIPVYQHPLTSPLASIRNIGKFLFVAAMAEAFGLIIVYVGIFVSPIPINWMIISWMAMLGCCVLRLFLVPQLYLHKVLLDIKTKNLLSFSKHLEEAACAAVGNPNDNNINRLEKLFLVQDRVLNSMQEWPLDVTSIVTLFSAVIFPLLLVIIDHLLK